MKAQYHLVQYIANPLRREVRNVGLIVRKGEQVEARFVGETKPNHVVKSKLRDFANPGIYAQWVDFWRGELRRGVSNLETILRAGGTNYRVLPARDVTQSEEDSAKEVLRKLFRVLVETPKRSPLAGGAQPSLVDSLELEFSKLGIFSDDKLFSKAKHPIRRGQRISGRSPHRPHYTQDNGDLCIIETFECPTAQARNRFLDQAGAAAYMFTDLRQSILSKPIRPIAVIQIGPDVPQSDSVQRAIEILRTESAYVVDWPEQDSRDEFLMERVSVAFEKPL